MTTLKRSDLRRIIKPIVREMVEETIEELILEESYLQDKIQESVLRGGVISHVITEVAKGIAKTTAPMMQQPQQYTAQPQQQRVQQSDQKLKQHIQEIRNNSELDQHLSQRANGMASKFARTAPEQVPTKQQQKQQTVPQQQIVQQNQPDWSTLQNVQLPPDDDNIGMVAPKKGMTVKEASGLMSAQTSAATQGEGLDINIIKQLAGNKGIWSPRKMNRFLQMGEKKWEKKAIKNTGTQENANE